MVETTYGWLNLGRDRRPVRVVGPWFRDSYRSHSYSLVIALVLNRVQRLTGRGARVA